MYACVCTFCMYLCIYVSLSLYTVCEIPWSIVLEPSVSTQRVVLLSLYTDSWVYWFSFFSCITVIARSNSSCLFLYTKIRGKNYWPWKLGAIICSNSDDIYNASQATPFSLWMVTYQTVRQTSSFSLFQSHLHHHTKARGNPQLLSNQRMRMRMRNML